MVTTEVDPIGTVRVHPDDDPTDRNARRRIAVEDRDNSGAYAGCRWARLTTPSLGEGSYEDPDPVPFESVQDWPVQPWLELAHVFGHDSGYTMDQLSPIIDEAHEAGIGAGHKMGFCKACGDNYQLMQLVWAALDGRRAGPAGEVPPSDFTRSQKSRRDLAMVDWKEFVFRTFDEALHLGGIYPLGFSRAVSIVAGRAVNESSALRQERDLAIAHDRQAYPTAEAYAKVCEVKNRFYDGLREILGRVVGEDALNSATGVEGLLALTRTVVIEAVQVARESELSVADDAEQNSYIVVEVPQGMRISELRQRCHQAGLKVTFAAHKKED